jgi:uncharacterized membrane protein YeaQ/YmgE (transglycosylase-associated protein family)
MLPLNHLIPEGEAMLHVLGWIVFGFIVGAIARFLMPGRQPMGFIMTTVLGVVGSFVGGVIANMLFNGRFEDPAPASWIGSILGAILVLFLYGTFANRTTTV